MLKTKTGDEEDKKREKGPKERHVHWKSLIGYKIVLLSLLLYNTKYMIQY